MCIHSKRGNHEVASVGITKLKITKMARCAEELYVYDESDEEIKNNFSFLVE